MSENLASQKTPTSFGRNEFSQDEVNHISNQLQKKLGKDHTTSRVGAGNSRFTYIESWRVIQLANQIFGFNGWSCSIVDISPDYIEESKGRFSVGVTAVVRITLRDGTTHEDVGYGMSENPRKGAAIELAKKEAVSDARKRTLRLFGDSLGNCLYDKNHLKRIKNETIGDDLFTDNANNSNAQPLPMMVKVEGTNPNYEYNPSSFCNESKKSSPPKINPNLRYQPYPQQPPNIPVNNGQVNWNNLPVRNTNQQPINNASTRNQTYPNSRNPQQAFIKSPPGISPTSDDFDDEIDLAALDQVEQNYCRSGQ